MHASALYDEKYADIGAGTELKNRAILLAFLWQIVESEKDIARLERRGGNADECLNLKAKLEMDEADADAHAKLMQRRYILKDAGDGKEYYGDGDQSDTFSETGVKLSIRASMDIHINKLIKINI
jgi:hypothetical protein